MSMIETIMGQSIAAVQTVAGKSITAVPVAGPLDTPTFTAIWVGAETARS